MSKDKLLKAVDEMSLEELSEFESILLKEYKHKRAQFRIIADQIAHVRKCIEDKNNVISFIEHKHNSRR